MAIKLGSNIASLSAQRRLGETGSELSKIFERLASGQRINRASDDAAGIAIADDLNAKSRVYTQAIRNGNDGISLLNIADSTIDALTSVVVRIRELSEQAANGTYSNKQRAALDAEAQALSKEFTRITQTTSFNGLKIFDGSLGSGLRLQLGYGISESINASIGGNIGSGEFLDNYSYSADDNYSYGLELADLNSDGILDLITVGQADTPNGSVTVRLGLGDGTFASASKYSEEGFTMSLSIEDVNEDGILDLISGGLGANSIAYTGVRLGLGDGSFGTASIYTMQGSHTRAIKLGDLNGDGLLDLVSTGYSLTAGFTSVRLATGNGNFGALTTYSAESSRSNGLDLGDINGDGILDLVTTGTNNPASRGFATVRLGIGNGTFGSATQYSTESNGSADVSLGDINGDGFLDLISAGYGATTGEVSIRLGNGSGSFGSITRYTTEDNSSSALEIGDVNGDGILDIITTGIDDNLYGFSSIRIGLGNGNFSEMSLYTMDVAFSFDVALGDLNGDGVLDLVTTGNDNFSTGTATIRLASTDQGLGALLDFSLKTRTEALQSMSIIDRTIQNLAKQRGVIGASQSRVNIAIQNLQTSRENFKAAESRIRDADIAAESANLIRTQILQQAASSVLSQANQIPSLALRLLS